MGILKRSTMSVRWFDYFYYFVFQFVIKTKCQKIERFLGIEPDITRISNARKRENKSVEEGVEYIGELIRSGTPFFAGRFGACELSVVRQSDFRGIKAQKKALSQLCLCAGFFPENQEKAESFCSLMKECMGELDVLGTWSVAMEDYYINRYSPSRCVTMFIEALDPRTNKNHPWSAYLKGKKVLVVHPFEKTIISQYQRRKLLYADEKFLPEFELITFKAVQTLAGEKDDRFADWFEALEYMKKEIEKLDFDIALVGCGAYGFPLAASIKQMGKQAIHMGGILQTLFGISGARWDSNENGGRIAKLKNEFWVYPSEEETPKEAHLIENGTYWKPQA